MALQPFLEIPDEEPFRFQGQRKTAQIASLMRALQIAKRCDHGTSRTQFTLIPEYSIPGLDGIAAIDAGMSGADWPSNTIVIGGTDSLTPDDYRILGARSGVHELNSPDNVQADQWINCGITWIKSGSGEVLRWLQPKIMPAWPEQTTRNARMFRGRAVNIYVSKFENSGPACRFLSLTCFDWIGLSGGKSVPKRILEILNNQTEDIVTLNWLFVMQYNDHPDNRNFLSTASDLLERPADFPKVQRNNLCIVFANAAGRKDPGSCDSYGHTSLVFSKQAPFDFEACPPTYCVLPAGLRGSDILKSCNDALFRERGACIHSYSQVVPNFLGSGPSSRSLPIQVATVHPIEEGATDRRTPAAAVPASVKWLNDAIDVLPTFSPTTQHQELITAMAANQSAFADAARTYPGEKIERTVKLARYIEREASKKVKPYADFWGPLEVAALQHVALSLDILRAGFPDMDMLASDAHSTFVVGGDRVVDVVAIKGNNHSDCLKHLNIFYTSGPQRQTLLVSRDDQNSLLPNATDGKFTSPTSGKIQAAPKIYETDKLIVHVSYQQLQIEFQRSTTVDSLRDNLHASLCA